MSRHPAPKVRALIDHLAESLGDDPPWDAFLRQRPLRRARAKKSSLMRDIAVQPRC